MKKKFLLAFVFSLCLLVLCGCSKSDALKFKEEYESLNGTTTSSGRAYLDISIDSNNPVVYSSYQQVIDLINNKETAIVYFGFAECPWCRNAVPSLLDALKEEGMAKLYYVHSNTERGRKSVDDNGNVVVDIEPDSTYVELLKVLDKHLPEYTLTDSNGNTVNAGEKRIYSPTVLFIKEGNIEAIYSDTVASQTDPYVALTADQKNELKNIYIDYIRTTTICDESC